MSVKFIPLGHTKKQNFKGFFSFQLNINVLTYHIFGAIHSKNRIKGLFTWGWGTAGRWGNLLRWGNLPVLIISHFNLITFTW